MPETISTNEQYSILAESPRRDERARVLKHGEAFAVFDHFGDIEQEGSGEEGLYHAGTRHLSRFRVLMQGRSPLLLSSNVRDDNSFFTVDMTNPDFMAGESHQLPKDTIHLFRSMFLYEGRCYCRFHLRSYALQEVSLEWSILYEADFADIFEVRGTPRERRGELLAPHIEDRSVRLRYRGLDKLVRATQLEFDPAPAELRENEAIFRATLPPQGELVFTLTIDCCQDGRPHTFSDAFQKATEELQAARALDAHVYTSNEQFNDWLNRSVADLHMMVTQTPHGPYPYAGVPWFSTAFGRDGIITALEYLWISPHMARGVLQYLAATQSQETDADRDAQPGKILHETRLGEMAELGEIPFRKYYGTADATPLFVMLAGAYYERTADRQLIASLWPNIAAALHWIEAYSDTDGDGFSEYARQSETGLVTQGWKDSFDSVFHIDGRLAEPPIALCEVQGYVYGALRAAAVLAEALGNTEESIRLNQRADQLQQAFEDAFWCDDIGTYALAIDRQKQACRVRTSNAGHLLFAGIARHDRAQRVADQLLGESMFSGWGIRTVATGEARYNPMAYHNGSVWPHDNALIACGLARYGFRQAALQVLTGLFDASLAVDLHRMPELFCGFPRRNGEGPTLYPVACAPQSWAAGAVFLVLQSCMGLTLDAVQGRITFDRPTLPEFLERVRIRNLHLGQARVDLFLERHPHDVGITVLRREGEVEVVVRK